MCLQNLVSTFRAFARKNTRVNPTDHHKVITPFLVMVIILLSLVTYSQSASSSVTYGNKSTDTRMNDSPFRLPFGTGFTSITTAAADTCQKIPITNATKTNLIDLTKPAAPTSIPVFTCTPNPQSHPNLTAGSVATNQIKARMAFAEMVSYKSFDVYYAATEETIEDMTNPYTPKTDPAGWTNNGDYEISDACDEHIFMNNGKPKTYPNGAFGSPYYSNSDKECIIPGLGKGGYSGKGDYHNANKIPVIPSADIFIIFWGVPGSWNTNATGSNTLTHISTTINNLFTGTDYISGLKQYGVTGPVKVIGNYVDTSTPMPHKYNWIKQTTKVIQNAINTRNAPTKSNHTIIYLVVTDAIKGNKSNMAPDSGGHSEITITIPA
jgi:hypothetical protein